MNDICLAAGVSKGGFYHHFGDRETVFLEIALEQLRGEVVLAAPGASDSTDRHAVSALLVDLWAWAPRHPRARRRVRAIHRAALKRLPSAAGRAGRDGLTPVDREAQATLALFMAIGRMTQRAMARDARTPERGQATGRRRVGQSGVAGVLL